ncbi:MAG: ABC transporter ATP-binding protein [Bacteroidales bacterium]|nr:ABC transporter ATP-binding protein [Bacteroidales bacterium]
MVIARGLTKSFGQLQVLRGIDLQIMKAEVVSLMGASGAGKTTLLQILGTLDRPTSGSVIIDGVDTLALKNNQLAHFRNSKIGFVFQFHQLLPEFTALENVMLPALIGGTPKPQAEARAAELLDFLNLSHRADHKPSQLSGGEKQRTAIARSLVNNPAVVFADEPTGNLDSHNADELQSLFTSLRQRFGQTFVIVTHDARLAERCDRMILIKDGAVYAD